MGSSDRYRDVLVQRLRALLESHRLSVLEIERQLGHGRGYLGDALRGHKKLSLEVILDVLDALDVEPEAFFERPRGDDEKPPEDPPTSSSPLVRAVLLLLGQRGVGQAELDEIRSRLGGAEPAGTKRAGRGG